MTSSVGFVARLGLAITQPRWALALATDRKHAGRSGSDLLLLLLVVLAATQLGGIFGGLWLGSAIDMSLGVQAILRVLTGALTLDLAFLVIGALLLFGLGGPRRDLGRAFDLACVAVLPLLYVELLATVIVTAADVDVSQPASMSDLLASVMGRASGVEVSQLASTVVSGIAYAWAGCLVALAVTPARNGTRREIAVPPAVAMPAVRAGWVVLVLALAGVALQLRWIAGHSDELRPMRKGDPAPAFALPSIQPAGKLGAPVALAASQGKVTVVEFWATWCGPCLKALPHLDALMREHKDVTVLAVNLDDSLDASVMWEAQRYRMTLLADDGSVSSRYGVREIPHVVVIDREGRVRSVARGGLADVEAAVEKILAEPIRN